MTNPVKESRRCPSRVIDYDSKGENSEPTKVRVFFLGSPWLSALTNTYSRLVVDQRSVYATPRILPSGIALKAMSWSLLRVCIPPRARSFTRRNVSLAHRIGEKCGIASTVDVPVRAAPVSSLTTSPHVSLEEKGLLVERLLKAKVSLGRKKWDNSISSWLVVLG